MNHEHTSGSRPPFWKTKMAIALAMVGMVVLFYLIREHWNHIGGSWIYVLLFICPLMHLFHGSHGVHRHGSFEKRSSDEGNK